MNLWMVMVAAWLAAWGVLLTNLLAKEPRPKERPDRPMSLLDGDDPPC